MDDVFNIENFNIIQDNDNYYFFRALNMADNADIDGNITTDENGNITRIRTDRERWEETIFAICRKTRRAVITHCCFK